MLRFCLVAVLWLGCLPARAESYLDQKGAEVYAEVYTRLGIELPEGVAHDPQIWRTLEVLKREACDQKALEDLAVLLERTSYRRQAALSRYNFVKQCGAPMLALHKAIDQLFNLSDYKLALEVANEFVRRSPTTSNAHYLRGVALYRLGEHQRAVTDFANAIELFGADRTRISSTSFVRMADAYASLGRYCEAASTILTWVAIDPLRRDDSRSQKMIDDYMRQGSCAQSEEFRKERFAATHGRSIVASGSINGLKGTFLIDTGASYVTVKKAFADRAKIAYADSGQITLVTANGPAHGRLTRADAVTLGRLQASAVPLVVQDEGPGAFGAGIDGLLGMSFLSRFELHLAGGYMEIGSRKRK